MLALVACLEEPAFEELESKNREVVRRHRDPRRDRLRLARGCREIFQIEVVEVPHVLRGSTVREGHAGDARERLETPLELAIKKT